MTNAGPLPHSRGVTLTDLPTELKAIIVKLRRSQAKLDNPISRGGWHPAIRDLSLVSKDFVPLCQEELFKDVRLEPVNCKLGAKVFGSPDTLSLFSNLAQSNPSLCGFVKTLTITIPNIALPKELATRIEAVLELMTSVEKLSIAQDPRGPSGPLDVKSLTEVGRRARAPRVVDALRKMVKSTRLSLLLLRGISLSPQDLMECTGLKSLLLSDSDLCSFQTSQYGNIAQSQDPIYLETIHMGDGDPCVLAACAINHHPKLSLSRVEIVNVPLQPEIMSDVLEHAESLKYLSTRPSTHDPLVVRDKGVLQWLHPNSFRTLLALELSINFNMRRQPDSPDTWPWIRDPYFALASDGLLLQLTALQKLEVKLSIQAGPDLDFDWNASFGDQWGALDRALVNSDGELTLKRLKYVWIRFAPLGDDYELEYVKRLKAYTCTRVQQRQFPRLSALCVKGGISFVYRYSVSPLMKKKWTDAENGVAPADVAVAA